MSRKIYIIIAMVFTVVLSVSTFFIIRNHIDSAKQKTAYEMRESDWSSDVCSSDLFAVSNCFSVFSRLFFVSASVSSKRSMPLSILTILP